MSPASTMHVMASGTVTVVTRHRTVLLETQDEDGDITVIHTREPCVLLSLAAALVNAAVEITPRDESITRGEWVVLGGYTTGLSERECVDGDGI